MKDDAKNTKNDNLVKGLRQILKTRKNGEQQCMGLGVNWPPRVM